MNEADAAGQSDDATRYWAALNEFRTLLLTVYDERAAIVPTTADLSKLAVVLTSLGALIVGVAALAVTVGTPDIWGQLAALSVGLVGLCLLWGGASSARARRARLKELAAYHARRPSQRDQWLDVILPTLSGRWSGVIAEDGVASSQHFLAAHWPGAAPKLLVSHQGAAAEDRLTFVTTFNDRPSLLQVVDVSAAARLRPPVLIVLMASPIDQAAVNAAIGQTKAGEFLERCGVYAGATDAGVYAFHPGPIEPISDATVLEDLVLALDQLCELVPPGAPVSRPQSVARARRASAMEVVDGFIDALRREDPLSALALLDPMIDSASAWEPTPQIIADLGLHPLSWEHRLVRTLNDVHRLHELTVALPSHPICDLSIHLSRMADAWVISGVLLADRLVLGTPFPLE